MKNDVIGIVKQASTVENEYARREYLFPRILGGTAIGAGLGTLGGHFIDRASGGMYYGSPALRAGLFAGAGLGMLGGAIMGSKGYAKNKEGRDIGLIRSMVELNRPMLVTHS